MLLKIKITLVFINKVINVTSVFHVLRIATVANGGHKGFDKQRHHDR